MTHTHQDSAPDARLRIDRWLWTARFFKTRSIAAQAIDTGQVRINDERVKAAKAVRIGDRVSVRVGDTLWVVTVRGIAERRGSAQIARTLFDEDAADRERRLAAESRRRAGADPFPAHGGRPEKRARRELTRVRGY